MMVRWYPACSATYTIVIDGLVSWSRPPFSRPDRPAWATWQFTLRTSLYAAGPIGGARRPCLTKRALFLSLLPRFVICSISESESDSVGESN